MYAHPKITAHILATDYGSAPVVFWFVFLLLAPLLTWTVGFLASRRGNDGRGRFVVASILSLFVGGLAFYSLPDAREEDIQLTEVFGSVELFISLASMLSAVYVRPRPHPSAKSKVDRHGTA